MPCELPVSKRELVKRIRDCVSSGRFKPSDSVDDVYREELLERHIVLYFDPTLEEYAENIDGILESARSIGIESFVGVDWSFIIMKRGGITSADARFIAELVTLQQFKQGDTDDDIIEYYSNLYEEMT